jgi:hypothetical protein
VFFSIETWIFVVLAASQQLQKCFHSFFCLQTEDKLCNFLEQATWLPEQCSLECTQSFKLASAVSAVFAWKTSWKMWPLNPLGVDDGGPSTDDPPWQKPFCQQDDDIASSANIKNECENQKTNPDIDSLTSNPMQQK